MDLLKLLVLEKSSEKVQELPEDFYQKAQKQIQAIKDELQTVEPDGFEAELLKGQINSEQRALQGIFNKRLSKILKRATVDAMRINPRQDKSVLQCKEVKFYTSVYEAIREAANEN